MTLAPGARLGHYELSVPIGAGGMGEVYEWLAEGEDLAERLRRGPIPVDEAIAIVKQVAEGLEEADEHGIIHRDLSPFRI